MILFAGIPSEPPLRLAIEAAETLGVAHVVLNQRQAEHVDIAIETGPDGLEGSIWIGGAEYPIGGLAGIYARPVDADSLPELGAGGSAGPDQAAALRLRATLEILNELLDVAPCPVVNRPSAMASNMSKPFQAQMIRRAGLLIPETLVTNRAEDLLGFHREHRRIIYKSISAVRSIVREWTPSDGRDASAVGTVPTQFQAFVPGTNVRVHVVGETCFATEIHSEAVDYRYGDREGRSTTMQPIELPAEVEAICIRLTRDLGLILSGIDLKRTPDGQWYCFEVNPSPAYSYFQELAGQPISEAIVRMLSDRKQDGSRNGSDRRKSC